MTISYRNSILDSLALEAHHLPRQPLVYISIICFFLLVSFESGVSAVVITGFCLIIVLLIKISSMKKFFLGQRTLTISDELLVLESSNGRSELRWRIVQKCIRTRNHIFMYVSQQSSIVIPRRAFESTLQWDTFYETCKRNTASAT